MFLLWVHHIRDVDARKLGKDEFGMDNGINIDKNHGFAESSAISSVT